MWHRAAALALALPAQMSFALDLEYVSHLGLYRPEIGLTEPSGLAVDPDGSGFWIVSDETRTVFRLETNGDLGAFTGRDDRMRDLEGVAIDAGTGRLLLVSEQTASVLAVSLAPPHRVEAVSVSELSGAESIERHLDDRRNGLEGIAVDAGTGRVMLAKEDAPRLLIEITPGLDRIVALRDLAGILPDGEDISGLATDPVRGGLWILSDTGRSVRFLPDGPDEAISLPLLWDDDGRSRPLDNPEGVALSPDGTSLFVLTDDGPMSKLVQYLIHGDAP